MKTAMKTALLALGLITALASGAGAASADPRWAVDHPRRAEVNARLTNQGRRIAVERRAGRLTPREARILRAEDRQVRREALYLAARHGGHITRSEQLHLNHEENRISHQIGR